MTASEMGKLGAQARIAKTTSEQRKTWARKAGKASGKARRKKTAYVVHYQTGRGTICSLDNDASIRTHTEDKSTVNCPYCINLLKMNERNDKLNVQ